MLTLLEENYQLKTSVSYKLVIRWWMPMSCGGFSTTIWVGVFRWHPKMVTLFMTEKSKISIPCLWQNATNSPKSIPWIWQETQKIGIWSKKDTLFMTEISKNHTLFSGSFPGGECTIDGYHYLWDYKEL